VTLSRLVHQRWMAALLASLFAASPFGEASESGETPDRPRLVVIIVIDQFRGDYIQAFEDYFTDDGFKKLCREGAWFTNALYDYGPTATGPGHASLLTGSTPSVHGIVGNNWEDLDDGGRSKYCCGDDGERILGLPAGTKSSGRSPRNLESTTLGDQLKAATGDRGQVWTVAIKDRAAILTGGKRADGAIWWDNDTGNYVSSTYYFGELPSWVQGLNTEHVADAHFKKPWDLAAPKSAYRVHLVSAARNDDAWRRYHGNEFPKILGRRSSRPDKSYYTDVYSSPFGNEVVLEAARRAVDGQKLGADSATDLLMVCLSANDVVGHVYGPDSAEVMDCSIRTDRQLAKFLAWVNDRVGLDQCLIAVTADHGVGSIPEYVNALGLGGGRLKSGDVEDYIEAQLRRQLGTPEDGRKYVDNVKFPWLWLDEETLAAEQIEIARAARLAAQIVQTYEGVSSAFAMPDLLDRNHQSTGVLERQIVKSYFPRRSGQVYIHWQRNWYTAGNAAGHGSAYDYDQHVPIIIRGAGIRPGRYGQRVCPTGLTITLCKLLGLDPPAGANGTAYDACLSSAP
jgi:hypothetical protein